MDKWLDEIGELIEFDWQLSVIPPQKLVKRIGQKLKRTWDSEWFDGQKSKKLNINIIIIMYMHDMHVTSMKPF